MGIYSVGRLRTPHVHPGTRYRHLQFSAAHSRNSQTRSLAAFSSDSSRELRCTSTIVFRLDDRVSTSPSRHGLKVALSKRNAMYKREANVGNRGVASPELFVGCV